MVQIKRLIGISFSVLLSFSAYAQSLPGIQEKSIRAPSSVKIDGKPDEWSDKFQAYNKTTQISYVISNDQDKLYLALQTSDLDIANKIINGGLTIRINDSDRTKSEGGGVAVTFPFVYQKDHRGYRPLLDYDKEVLIWNKQLADKTKDISVSGIMGVKDTLSIYNAEGIRVATLFGEDQVFTYELAIPLKYVEQFTKAAKAFVYTITLNGSPNYSVPLNYAPSTLGRDGTVTYAELPAPLVVKNYINQIAAFEHIRSKLIQEIRMPDRWNLMTMYGPNAALVVSLITPTELSGQYTLAK